jgi:hypothetical protein
MDPHNKAVDLSAAACLEPQFYPAIEYNYSSAKT